LLDAAIVFLDLETTGATSHFDRITEIGCVEVEGGRFLGEWSTLVNPGIRIPPAIQALTGITDAMVESAPSFADIAEGLAERLRGKLLIAHNARFDYGFLRNEFKRLGVEFASQVVCTVKLSRKLYPQHRRHNLDSLISRHNIQCSERHRALGDARALWDFVQVIAREFDAEHIADCVKPQLAAPALPPAIDAVQLAGLPARPGVYLFYGENNSVLYVGKSVNLRSRVLSHFSGDYRVAKDMFIKQQMERLEWRETCGELGALLLESRLIKELSPAHNRHLRASSELYSILCDPLKGTATVVGVLDVAAEAYDDLAGLFRSRREGENALRGVIEANELCPLLSGLEKGRGPCFSSQLKRCRGACCGREPLTAHAARLVTALRSLRPPAWPFPGTSRIGIREYNAEREAAEVLVFERWCYLGCARDDAELAELAAAHLKPVFDLDTQQILIRYFKRRQGRLEVIDLTPLRQAA
jgi:DNA polymerase III subunit epsilon